MDITLLNDVVNATGTISRLYYYQGNFFHPLFLAPGQEGRVKRAIRMFGKANKELIAKDRAHPKYKNLIQLFDVGPYE